MSNPMVYMAHCELCNQYESTRNMTLFLLKEKRLTVTHNRDWEQKAGVRHICPKCIREIQQLDQP